MDFPTTAAKIPGYDPEQVDVLIARLGRQYESPQLKLVTSSMLDVVKFDLVPGGYQIPAVDAEIARFAEMFLEREIAGKVKRAGRDEVSAELSAALREVKRVLERKPGMAFAKSRNGYKPRQVKALLKRIEIKRGSIADLDTLKLRTMSISRSRSGFDRSEVDAFLGTVVRALHCQRALN
jgi:DivIVA domain-containing protein